MVNTVFKGDIAEVSWGKETGLISVGTNAATGFTHTSKTGNTSLITFGTGNYWIDGSNNMLLPDNALVGCIITIDASAGSNTNFDDDDYASKRRSYYIIANDQSAKTITVQPALATATSTNGHTSDILTIHSIRCPTLDVSMTAANQQVKTDQFFGLLNSLSIPEPEIDVKMQHVIGMGRDVNVLTSGRETLSGGNIAVNAHTLRWLKYALGGVSSLSQGEFTNIASSNTALTEAPLNLKATIGATATNLRAQEIGASNADTITAVSGATLTGLGSTVADGKDTLVGHLTVASTGDSTTVVTANDNWDAFFESVSANGGIWKAIPFSGTFGNHYGFYGSSTIAGVTLANCGEITAGASDVANAANSVVHLLANLAASSAVGDFRLNLGATIAGRFTVGDYVQIIDKNTITIPGADTTLPTVFKHEIRRVVAVDGAFIYVEEPFQFAHTINQCGVERLQYRSDSKRGSPFIDPTTKELSNGVTHTVFGADRLPTFMIEQSFRKTDETPGSGQLLRLYNGCKVNNATVSADSEGELKVSIDYEATRHYTDTGSNMRPHRMFENTANSATARAASGIAVDGEKPYLFQDMSIEVFGAPVLRGTQFEFGVANNNATRFYIRGFEGNQADTDQVQLGSTQTAFEITEAQRGYTFKFSAIIEDDRLWEQLRTRKHHLNTNDIVIRLKKRGQNATRESATITIEDYTILKADHQIPDDKGAVIVEVELAVRHLKFTENSPYYTL